ncbi:MAG TPA: RnfABCDGE type electron transport complex subunit D [Treponemataceae bacterium]|nr:RnfABCDGE type electron transport complex subunit D [Treponemataceae bacterium]
MNKPSWKTTLSPFLVTRPTISHMSLITALTLTPHILAMVLQHDYRSLVSISVAIAGSVAAELSVSWNRRNETLGDGTAILTGLLTGFLLPYTLGPFMVFFVSFSGSLVSRAVFGGTGAYWMNPAAVAVCLGYLSQGDLFPPYLVTPESVSAAGDAFGALKIDQFPRIPADTAITDFLNKSLLNRSGISLPEGYITLFWNSPSTIPAFRYNILTLVASIALLSLKIIDWIVPAVFLATYGACVYLFTPVSGAMPNPLSGDILFAVLTGGILFTAFYLLPEFSTVPRTRVGKLVSGLLAGLICFLLCGPGGSPAGAVFTVISVNPLATIIEYLEKRILALRSVHA